MAVLPDKLEGYRKFFSFMLKYYNSDVFTSASQSAMGGQADEEDKAEEYGRGPEELVEDLKSMGPTYIKLGQLLSTRPDLLPDTYLQALTSLQDDVDEIPYSEVQAIVEEELGVKISNAFTSFREKPLASASIGQVHEAVLRSGRKVAVKVQRPGMRKKFMEDLDTLTEISALAVKHSKAARKYAMDDVVQELRHILLQELDYTREAQNLTILSNNLQEFQNLVVPQPVADYSSSKVLTMDLVEGKKITSVKPLEKMENDYTYLVNELVEAYLKQIIVDGFAHADPHPGNVHLTGEGKVALMDLGMVAKFSPQMQENLLRLLVAMSQNNGDTIASVLLDMSEYNDKQANIPAFKKKINRLVMDSQSRLAEDMETGRVLIQMNRIAAEEGIKIAVELNILGKILLNLDQVVAALAPKFDLQEAINRYAQKIMQSKMVKELKPENFFTLMLQTKKLAENLPERLNKITENLANNQFEMKIDAIDEQRFTDGFQKVANRITLGLIIAALIIGAAMLMRVPTTFNIMGYPGIAIIFFLGAAFAGMLLAYRIIIKDEDFKKKKF